MNRTLTLFFLILIAFAWSSKQSASQPNPQDKNQNANQMIDSTAASNENESADESLQAAEASSDEKNNRDLPAGIAKQLNEANRSFTYEGKPINPRAVNELLVWISDGIDAPGPIAIDLNGTNDTNRYYGDYQKDKDGRVTIDFKNISPKKGDQQEGYFIYKRLGTLQNGIHVLETWENEGGSGVWTSLLLVKFGTDYEYRENGSRRYRLVMQRMGEIILGDRYDRYGGRITIQNRGNTIRIAPSVYPNGEKIPGKVIRIK